ncbi:hypothetical protein G647_01442 [Cladophialophora carrionii CBS 160.54]|uniref:Uncharacterized protein n=1 Tax=Cladophialophora carrionii CBS 160.54 TaxID=1279043 RepID=V9DQ38_9EURO|nr:uncharacterized protein G647_01442 [Cladophialophora carrionii CBS 160.54]ETI28990.1 hypothetical protein G647_01442 [Cladophialophora carrionii CBS 160.54]
MATTILTENRATPMINATKVALMVIKGLTATDLSLYNRAAITMLKITNGKADMVHTPNAL